VINIFQIASGSSGNNYRISDGKTVIMIECGIRFKKIREAFNFKLSEVSGCLLSHCHGDHAKAVKDVMKAGINVYTSPGTIKALNLSGHRLKPVKPLELFTVGTFRVLPFPTEHDCKEPFGFLIQSGTEKLCFITDTFYCKYKFSGVTHFIVECNYSKEILEENIKSGVVPAAIRNRIVKSHFEIENVKEFFRANDLSAVKQIFLIHISSNNGDPKLFKSEIQKLTGKEVYA